MSLFFKECGAYSLGQIGIVSEASIVHFLAERVQHNVDFRNQLRTVVKISEVEAAVSQAAANTITILIKTGNHLNGVDPRGIRIPSADLFAGQFDSAQLHGANLNCVSLT